MANVDSLRPIECPKCRERIIKPVIKQEIDVSNNGFWHDFLAFRKMLAPVLIQIIFWPGIIGCLVYGVGLITNGKYEYEKVVGFCVIFLGPVFVRLLCEGWILFFRMNETLTDIRNILKSK